MNELFQLNQGIGKTESIHYNTDVLQEELMTTYSLRMTDYEKRILQDYAKTHGISMADALKSAFFDMLEDQFDIRAADEAYEEYRKDPETISMADMKKKYGI